MCILTRSCLFLFLCLHHGLPLGLGFLQTFPLFLSLFGLLFSFLFAEFFLFLFLQDMYNCDCEIICINMYSFIAKFLQTFCAANFFSCSARISLRLACFSFSLLSSSSSLARWDLHSLMYSLNCSSNSPFPAFPRPFKMLPLFYKFILN